uniref:Uncharacterized protein n=2 Tax=Rhizophora mucronata TaxID=61149 RepID=A0A2P2MUA0_RHIMU
MVRNKNINNRLTMLVVVMMMVMVLMIMAVTASSLTALSICLHTYRINHLSKSKPPIPSA